MIYYGLLFFFIGSLMGCSLWTKPSVDRQPSSISGVSPDVVVNQLRPFQSMGCSKFYKHIPFPNVDKWQLCCVQHNAAYWKGGTQQDRYAADQRLQNCVLEVGRPDAAGLIYKSKKAASLLAQSEDDLPWGYGWKANRGYAPFTEKETQQVEKLEKQIPEELSKVELVLRSKIVKAESLTSNMCMDAAVEFIQKTLSRKLTPLSVNEKTSSVSGETGVEYTLSI